MNRFITAAAVAALAAFAPMAQAATPSSGTVSNNNEVTWSGTPLASNPAACPTATDPSCDHFTMTIANPGVKRVLVAIAAADGFEDDDYDLFVYDDQGTLVGSSASSGSRESVVFANGGAPFYEVRVQPFTVSPGSSYNGVAMKTKEMAFDSDSTQDCLELVPENVSVSGVLDAGQRVELSVQLLLDGTDPAVAAALMKRAADSYRPLGIDLVLVGTQNVSYTTTISNELIAAAKSTVGGVPPKGIDLVGVFTTKQMQAIAGGATVVGQADCIGGIRYDDRSFFVVSDIRNIEDPKTGTTGTLASLGFNANVDATAEVFAHEIGHLMGAHHHYANCVEGGLSSGAPNDLSPCTLMFNAVNFASLNYSTLSGTVVRGHAINHAAP